MIPYLATFSSSLLFTFFAQYEFKKSHTKLGWLWSVIAILIPCWLAGMRADSVGIDVMVYAQPEYLKAIKNPSFFRYYKYSSCEPLYSLLVFYCSKIGDSASTLLFATQLLTIIPVYLSAYIQRKNSSMTLVMMGYFFFYYNLSLSIMRQSVSMAIVILVYTLYLEKDQFSKMLIPLIVIAGLFHYFAFLVFLVLFVVEFCIRSNRSVMQKGFIIVAIIIVMINIKRITILFAGFMPTVFGKYALVLNQINYSGFSISDTIFKMVALIFCLLPRNRIDQSEKKKIEKKSYMVVLGLVFQIMAFISEYLLRISYYFQFFMLLPFGTLKHTVTQKDKVGMYLGFFIYAFLYWYIVYTRWGWHGTYPYVFR